MEDLSKVKFDNVEKLASDVRRKKFEMLQSGEDWSIENAPLEWFLKAWELGDFEAIFRVWDSGLESMKGDNLYNRCIRMVFIK